MNDTRSADREIGDEERADDTLRLEPVVDGKYELIRPIGEGGFSWVFLARHVRIPSLKVAIKVLKATHAFDGATVRRFTREAEAAAVLTSRHSVKVTDIGTTNEGFPYLAMELVRGVPLRSLLKHRETVSPFITANLARDVLTSLVEAHQAGLIHRDIKPSNIFVLQQRISELPEAKVIDFGIARVVEDVGSELSAEPMTAQGNMVCTPAYAGPEVLKGEPAFQSDLYSLGLVMLEMLTGELPYPKDNEFLAASKQLSDDPVPIEDEVLQGPLGQIIAQATNKDLKQRYGSAAEMLEDLEVAIGRMTLDTAQSSNINVIELIQRYTRKFEDNDVVTSSLELSPGMVQSSAANSLSVSPATRNSLQSGKNFTSQTIVQDSAAYTGSGAQAIARQRFRARFGGALVLLLVIGIVGISLAMRFSGDSEPAKSGGETWQRHAVGEIIDVDANIAQDTVWTADKTWRLTQSIFVEHGATLSIEPGTTIVGSGRGALIVTRGSSLHANGAKGREIVFTSERAPGERLPGDWAGIVLLGDAPTNMNDAPVDGLNPLDTRAYYGGRNPLGSCGVLTHVVIEYAGFEYSANNELNGLTLAGCGAGTIVRNVTIGHTLDDGLEILGGTVNLNTVAVIYPGDDGLDWDAGWTGKGQHIVVVLGPRSDSAIEADNKEGYHLATPVSDPQLRNVTLVGSGERTVGQWAIKLRRGSGISLHNSLIVGFPFDPIDVRDEATVRRLQRGESTFERVLISAGSPNARTLFAGELGGEDDDDGFSEDHYFSSERLGAQRDRSVLMREHPPIHSVNGLLVDRNSELGRNAAAAPDDEFWDRGSQYLGAFRPGAESPWFTYDNFE